MISIQKRKMLIASSFGFCGKGVNNGAAKCIV